MCARVCEQSWTCVILDLNQVILNGINLNSSYKITRPHYRVQQIQDVLFIQSGILDILFYYYYYLS